MTTIDDVIERMRSIAGSLRPGDGVGTFNLVYERTTVAIRNRLATGFFSDDALVERFDVAFAERYFAAVAADTAGERPSAAWRPLFERRADERVSAVQFAVAGMNAHINHDLALAVVDVCTAADVDPRAGTFPDDYQKVTDVLEEIESQMRLTLLDDLERQIGRPFEPLLHLVSSWSIGQAREAAWVRALVLWELRAIPLLFRQESAVLAKAVGMTSRQLLTPLLPSTLLHPGSLGRTA